MLRERGDAAEMAQPWLVQGCVCSRWALPSAGPVKGSGKTPHEFQRLPGQQQLEIPAEGHQRLPSLARLRGSGCGRCQPHGDGFVGGSAIAPRSQFPMPVSYRGDIPPPAPQNEQTQPDPRLTWGSLFVWSIARSGLTSSGEE